jgi:ferritin-like metal-binding protein YciE
MRRHRNENELREDINKHQSETKNPIKKDIWVKNDNTKYKRGVDKVMENLRRGNQTEILEIKSPFSQTKNTVEGTQAV